MKRKLRLQYHVSVVTSSSEGGITNNEYANLSSQNVPLHELYSQNIRAQMVKHMLYSAHVGEYTDQIKFRALSILHMGFLLQNMCLPAS